ncbi:MAG: SGNH/GDSL hydrolase family protein [Endomicrobiales bacterium]
MRYLKELLTAFAGLCIGLLLMELLLRTLPGYSQQAMLNANFNWDHCEDRPSYRPSKLFGYELIPNANPSVNSFGMRDREYSRAKPAGVFRILLLGDSICQLGRWHEYLEEALNLDRPVEILNAGVSAWGLNQYYLYLKHKGLQFEPDLVLIGLCLNDVDARETPIIFPNRKQRKTFFYTISVGQVGSRPSPNDVNFFLFRHCALYRFLAAQYLLATKDKRITVTGDMKALAEMKEMTRGRILGVVFPYLKPLSEYDDRERGHDYERTKQYLEGAGIENYDLTADFNRYGAKIISFREWPHDKIHFNDAANRMKAELLSPWLKKKIRDFSEN